MSENRFEVIRTSPQASVGKDKKTPERGMVVKSVFRDEPLHANVWEGKSAVEIAGNYQKTLALLHRPEFGLAKYIPPTRVQVVDNGTVNVVQREIVGQTLRQYLKELAKNQADYSKTLKLEVPEEIVMQLNDILLRSLQMAIETTRFSPEQLPYGITSTRSGDLPEMRQPVKGEGVAPEVIGPNAMDNIMVGVLHSQRRDPEVKPQLWLTDCAAVFIADKAVAVESTRELLYDGFSRFGIYDLLSDKVYHCGKELDRVLKES